MDRLFSFKACPCTVSWAILGRGKPTLRNVFSEALTPLPRTTIVLNPTGGVASSEGTAMQHAIRQDIGQREDFEAEQLFESEIISLQY
jgi:hypothetical protein